MKSDAFAREPHLFWQEIMPSGTFNNQPVNGHRNFFPANLPDGRQLALPIRELSDGKSALASLIVNQASFEVVDALGAALAERAKPFQPDIVVGVPTLGLTLAPVVARELGHRRFVPLSTSRKFWYQEELSVPLKSITSPGQTKRLYIDPRMLPLLENKRIMLIDDVLSTGTSIVAALNLLKTCGFRPTVIGAAMLQTNRWQETLDANAPGLSANVIGVFNTPRLTRMAEGGWIAEP